MIDGLFNSGAMPVLEQVIHFTEARQRVLADDVANLSTPYFKPADLNVAEFQSQLRQAIETRRNSPDGASPFPQLNHGEAAHAEPTNDGILFHDENNRDVERLMAHVAENQLTHRMAIELLRGEMGVLRTAIRERV